GGAARCPGAILPRWGAAARRRPARLPRWQSSKSLQWSALFHSIEARPCWHRDCVQEWCPPALWRLAGLPGRLLQLRRWRALFASPTRPRLRETESGVRVRLTILLL